MSSETGVEVREEREKRDWHAPGFSESYAGEPGPAKTRRAPSRLCRDARSIVIYDYGMQDY